MPLRSDDATYEAQALEALEHAAASQHAADLPTAQYLATRALTYATLASAAAVQAASMRG